MEPIGIYPAVGELIAQSRSGDREAFGRIVRQYQGIVSGVTFGILGDFHKSEDIAQETFLVAWHKLDELREIEKLSGWLCGIARNLARQHLTRLPRVRVVPVSQTEEIAEHKNDPAELLAKQEQNRLIWGALEKIPEKYRIPLVLFYRSGQSIAEIAAALEISENALNVRLTRARKFLRKELEKQVAGSIADSGPGELFSLAVIAALPVAAGMTSAGKAMAATVIGAESTIAAAGMATAPESGTPGATLFGTTTFWLAAQPVLYALGLIVSYALWVVGAVPGIWFSIRNAPTLRARRFLVLVSLWAHLLFATWCFLVALGTILFHGLGIIFGRGSFYYTTEVIAIIVCCFFWIFVAVHAVATMFRYRLVVREDAGLVTPKKPLPLEESPFSFRRIEKIYRNCFNTFLVYFGLICLFIVFDLCKTVFHDQNFSSTFGQLSKYFSYYGTQLLLLSSLFLLVFRKVHRHFLAIVKDEESFAASPPLVTRDTPYWTRVWIEWNVSFGVFLVAAMVGFLTMIRYVLYFPLGTCCTLLLISAGSFVVAMLSARFSPFRWLINVAGAFAIICVAGRVFFHFHMHRKVWDYFKMPDDWPQFYAFGIFNLFIMFTVFMILVYGGLSLKRKWSGMQTQSRTGRRTALVYAVGLILILSGALLFQSRAKLSFYWFSGVIGYSRNSTPSEQDVRKSVDYFCEAFRMTPEVSQDRGVSMLLMSGTLWRCHDAQPAAVIDGFDRVIAVVEKEIDEKNTSYQWRRLVNERGCVRFLHGDYRGAIADFSRIADRIPLPHLLYNRGYAHEKLGEIDAAIADYSAAIEQIEKYDYNRNYESFCLPRETNAQTRNLFHASLPGVSAEELKAIRDNLRKPQS